MLKHEEMTINFKDSSSATDMREECAKDLERFYLKGSWWKGSHGEQFKNKPKPEFNKVWRSINRVIGDINDMELNAVIVSNSDEATDEGADLLQKRWRNDFQSSDGIEASEIATMEAAVGGFGCTKLIAKYEDEENPDPEKQYLCAEIVHSACHSVFFDAGAIRKDKADSRWGWHLIRTNRKKVEEEFGVDVTSFMNPVSLLFSSNCLDYESPRDIYLAHYYEVIEKSITEYDFSMMNGLVITSGDGIKDDIGNKYTREELKEMREMYLEFTGEEAPMTRRKVKYVEYALCDGEKYLTKPQRVPFKRVPLFPRYGYYAVLNGREYYCGEVRKQSDYEMFHNYFGSTMMEIMAAPQVSKPEYTPQQIAKHANQRARADIDNVPFLMSDPLTDKEGNITHLGPISIHQPPQLGSGLAAAGQFLQSGMQEMASSGQATVPANSSAQAIQQVNDRNDDTFLPLVKNVLHSIKAQCDAWIPAAQTLYFSNQRRLRVLEADGTYTQVTTLEMSQDPEGNYGPYGNNPKGKYSVQVEQGEAYRDAREAERQTIIEMLPFVGTDTAFGQLLSLQAMTLTSGEGGDRIRRMARYKMLELAMAQGYPIKPDNEEEEAFMMQTMQKMQMQAQMAGQNDPNMIAAKAQDKLANAELMDKQVDMYNAETKRMEAITKAQKAGADVKIDQANLQLKALGNLQQSSRMM